MVLIDLTCSGCQSSPANQDAFTINKCRKPWSPFPRTRETVSTLQCQGIRDQEAPIQSMSTKFYSAMEGRYKTKLLSKQGEPPTQEHSTSRLHIWSLSTDFLMPLIRTSGMNGWQIVLKDGMLIFHSLISDVRIRPTSCRHGNIWKD